MKQKNNMVFILKIKKKKVRKSNSKIKSKFYDCIYIK